MTIEDPAEKGFITDSEELTDVLEEAHEDAPDGLIAEPESATVFAPIGGPDLSILDVRPSPGRPRDYQFPKIERIRLSNGLTVVHTHLPGRALLAAHLIMPGGGWTEQPDKAGVTVLAARAMPEGTRRLSAIEFVEESERLGAEIHADASWELLSATLEVPRSRFGPALALLAEMAFEPAFPDEEVQRLRDERMNDLLQAWSDPRRRAERVFPETLFSKETPYSRPLAGVQTTIRPLDRDAVAARHAGIIDPSVATLVIAGDLAGVPLEQLAEEHLGGRESTASASASASSAPDNAAANPHGAQVVLVDRPGAPQSELRIGHIGVPRKNPDFHSIAVLNAILGGTFNSRLNRVIREEKGYSYGINSSFEMRRRSGPFAVRCAVETAVTVPAIEETLRIVRDMTQVAPTDEELTKARDYLVGVFPLRFETSGQVASALAGLVVFELPDDELDRYRPEVAAISAEAVTGAAQRNIRPADLSVVIVGDANEVEAPLLAAGIGELTVVPADASPE